MNKEKAIEMISFLISKFTENVCLLNPHPEITKFMNELRDLKRFIEECRCENNNN